MRDALLLLQRSEALRAAEHDGCVRGERNQSEDNENRT
jgi:hypothetical protein